MSSDYQNKGFRELLDSLSRKYIEAFHASHKFMIDTTEYKSDFVLSQNSKRQTGFETFISTKNLTEGKHILRLKRFRIRRKDTSFVTDVTIPFWYFKNN